MKTTSAAAIDAHPEGTDHDPPGDKDFLIVIPGPNSLTPWEQRAADTGTWPIRLQLPSTEALAGLLKRRGAPGRRGDTNAGRGAAATNDAPPSIDAFLASLVRNAVRDELERVKPHEAPTALPAVPAIETANDRLTVPQVAQHLHVTPATVREWIKAGDLKANRIGPEGRARIYSVARADLDDFLHRRRVNPVVHDIDTQADEILQTLDTDGGK